MHSPQGNWKGKGGQAGELRAQTPATVPEGRQAGGPATLQLALATLPDVHSPLWLYPESPGEL